MCETAKTTLPPGITPIGADEARTLIRHTSGPALEALLDRAEAVRRAVHGDEVALCGITNAKSGRCPENCGFCSQSAHFPAADAPVYPLVPAEEIVAQAKAAERAGAREFSIVTSGTRVAKESELATIEEAVRKLRAETAVEPCASLGLVREPELVRLKAAGLMHYHHNLETARSFFENVCTTHTYDEQLETIRAAKRQGLQLCSGGILGMGETPEQRVELAETIRELGVHCVPMNFLNPRPGTPMEHVSAITAEECLAAIAVFRLMMPAAHIFVMGGREVNLGVHQHLIFRAGANGTMIGNYLTSAGRGPGETVEMVEAQGLSLRAPDTGRAWSFDGTVPPDAEWNRRAAEPGGKRALPVVGAPRGGCA
ncbi:biotin synthase BioB [Anaeromyxobacter soli]|uniref:biotin synthase BioB n=1 Tax=Anaeromyxobacter soli TaxID=2922725 RepID=UPI001FB01845|nr:biotin synthase BioB [Anaeromyxobacter sp. SG29]